MARNNRIFRRASIPLAVLLLAGLAGCTFAPDGTEDPPASPSAVASTSPSPSPSASPSAPPRAAGEVTASGAFVPDDCRGLVDAATYAATFADAPLNEPLDGREGVPPSGDVEPEGGEYFHSPFDGRMELICYWGGGHDEPHLDLSLAVVEGDVMLNYFTELQSLGAECVDALEGRRCQESRELDGARTTRTYFVRDDIAMIVDQREFPTDDLLGSVSATIWAGR